MVFDAIIRNKCLLAPAVAWAIAQSIKIILTYIIDKKLDWSRLVGTGGMPSSHSALMMALSVSVGKYYGFDSPMFAIALIMAFVVMYDAAGIRRAAGGHARILNKIMHQYQIGEENRVKELLGHTPFEVSMGALLGIVVGYWL